MKIKFIFAWYDLWIGIFIDREKGWLYILPVPMLGVVIKLLPIGYSIIKIDHWIFGTAYVPMYHNGRVYTPGQNGKLFSQDFTSWWKAFKAIRQYRKSIKEN
jgi:hypothetical protein